jgi:hypothetical protein
MIYTKMNYFDSKYNGCFYWTFMPYRLEPCAELFRIVIFMGVYENMIFQDKGGW